MTKIEIEMLKVLATYTGPVDPVPARQGARRRDAKKQRSRSAMA